jgi:dipeptidyl aminopeptidase/acylaminoacyl peptidase
LLLFVLSDKDSLVPLEQSQVLDERLRAAGVASTLVIVQNGEHNLRGSNTSPTAEGIMQMIITFLENYLK